jgi:hypothetical protein
VKPRIVVDDGSIEVRAIGDGVDRIVHGRVHVVADELRGHLAATFVRNVGELDARLLFQTHRNDLIFLLGPVPPILNLFGPAALTASMYSLADLYGVSALTQSTNWSSAIIATGVRSFQLKGIPVANVAQRLLADEARREIPIDFGFQGQQYWSGREFLSLGLTPAMRSLEHLMEQQATLLRTFAQRLVEGPKRLLDQQEALLSAIKSRAFQGEDLDTAFRLLTETTARLMRIERVSIWRYTAKRDAIRCVDLYELSTSICKYGDVSSGTRPRS